MSSNNKFDTWEDVVIVTEKLTGSRHVVSLLRTTYRLLGYGIKKPDRQYVAIYQGRHKKDVFYLCFWSHDRDEKVTSVKPSFKGRDWQVRYYEKLGFETPPRYRYGIQLCAFSKLGSDNLRSVFLSETARADSTLFPGIGSCAVEALCYDDRGIKHPYADEVVNMLHSLSFCGAHYDALMEKGVEEYACVMDYTYKEVVHYFKSTLGFEGVHLEPNLETPAVKFDRKPILSRIKRHWTDWDKEFWALHKKLSPNEFEEFFDSAINRTFPDSRIIPIGRAVSYYYRCRNKHRDAYRMCEKYCKSWWDEFLKRTQPGEHELRLSCVPKYVTILLEEKRYRDALSVCDMADEYGFDVARLRTRVLKARCLLDDWSLDDPSIFLLTKTKRTIHRNHCDVIRRMRKTDNLLAIKDIDGALLWGNPCKMCCSEIEPRKKPGVNGLIIITSPKNISKKMDLCHKYSISFDICSERYATLFTRTIEKLFPQRARDTSTIERGRKLITSYDLAFGTIDEKLKKLLGIVFRHGRAKMAVDGEPIDSRELGFLQSCQYREKCDGVCSLLHITKRHGSYSAFKLTEIKPMDTDEETNIVEISEYAYHTLRCKDVLDHFDENLFTLNKAKIMNNVARQLVPMELCEQISIQSIINYVNELPNKVRVSFESPKNLKAAIREKKGIRAIKDYHETDIAAMGTTGKVFEFEWKVGIYKRQKWVRYNKLFLSKHTDRILLVRNKVETQLIDLGGTAIWEKEMDSAVMGSCFLPSGVVMIATRSVLVSYDELGQELQKKKTSTGRHDYEHWDQVLLGQEYIAFYLYSKLSMFDHKMTKMWSYAKGGPWESLLWNKVDDSSSVIESHLGSIMCGSMNSNGLVAVGTNRGEICVYNVAGKMAYFAGYCEAINEFIYSADTFWKRLNEQHGTARVNEVAISDVDYLVAQVNGSMALFSMAEHILWKVNFGQKPIGMVFIASDGTYCGCTVDNVCFVFRKDGTLVQRIECQSKIGDAVIDTERGSLFLYDNNLNCYAMKT